MSRKQFKLSEHVLSFSYISLYTSKCSTSFLLQAYQAEQKAAKAAAGK